MKRLKSILDFYIDTSIHVGFAVFSLAQITKMFLNSELNVITYFFIFFGTVFGYNFLKYFDVFLKNIFIIKKNYSIVVVSLVAGLGMFFCFYQLETTIQMAFFKISALVLLYPFIRKFGLIKMVVVAFCVTYITVYIPGLCCHLNWIYLIQRFLFIFCLLIPLEIFDLESDSKTLITLPQFIGIKKTKWLGYFLLILCLILELQFFKSKLDLVIDIIILIVTAIFIFFSNENRYKYYTSFWVESIPIFWWITFLIFRQIF